jgi:transcriptional regulator with XRE-family HTH domain
MHDAPLDRIEASARATPRPQASVDDRQFVPGALAHWRRVHGLSQREAQTRVGYSSESNTWARWEAGTMAPPYRVLLRVLAATGLGYWVDTDGRLEMDPEERLAHDQHRIEELRATRRAATVDGARQRVGGPDGSA